MCERLKRDIKGPLPVRVGDVRVRVRFRLSGI